jgi:cell division transport system ATP-binding protein
LSENSKSHHIEFEDIEVKYSDYVYGLRGVSLAIEKGEFVFLVGKTGTGKSTLLKLLTKEVRPTAGRAKLWGLDIEEIPDKEIPLLRRTMGIVPQDYGLLPRKNVWENIAYAMRANGVSKKEVRKRLPEILERVNIGHRVDAFPHQLSGGEQQRVAIGRAIINNPQLIIADEPTGNLDPEHSWEIMEVLSKLNAQGTTVLVASHDMLVVERMEKRIVTLQGGRIASDITPEPTLFAIGADSETFASSEPVVEPDSIPENEPDSERKPDLEAESELESEPVAKPEQEEETPTTLELEFEQENDLEPSSDTDQEVLEESPQDQDKE